MGTTYDVICDRCGHKFRASSGGGFFFHLLHCNKCGSKKSIGFDEIGETHLKYLKGLPYPYSIATQASDKHVQDNYPGEPISKDEYHREVERLAGSCECGGRFTLKSRPRCPKCKSAKWTKDPKGSFIDYD